MFIYFYRLYFCKNLKTVRRIDPKKVEEIKKLLAEYWEVGFSRQETIFGEYKRIQKATLLEHAAANYPLSVITNPKSNKKKIDADVLKSYNKEIKAFNKNLENPDEEIIGVPYTYQDIQGNECRIFYRELANPENIKKSEAVQKCDQRIAGEKKKKERIIVISSDKDIKKRQDAKLRVQQRRLNKGKREGGSNQ